MQQWWSRLGIAAGFGALAVGLTLPVAAQAWWWNSTYTETEYPIVLAHGAAGFDELFGVYEYFYGIPSDLEGDGATVFVTQVPAFGSTELRGEALLDEVEDILALTGASKVNLIGHSHGGLDVRYVASVAPHLVASVTTVGSPHQGAELADLLRDGVEPGGFSESVLSLFADALGDVLSLLSGAGGTEQDSVATLDSLTSTGLASFNATHPNGLPTTPCGDGPDEVNGIRFYSWSGDRTSTNLLDPSDALLVLTGLVYNEDNDGLVGVCSSHLGRVIRDDYNLNHLDEVNQVFGLTYLFGPNPKSLFRTHANRLKNEGL
ncbi:MAG: triacylglycerol lipase [Myxococcota bacterium]